MPRSKKVVKHRRQVTAQERERILRQHGCVVCLTGLPGSGKSTIASGLEVRLVKAGRLAYVLDEGNVRHGLNSDLGFSAPDRAESVRRVGEVAAILADAGNIVITSLITPFRKDRKRVRQMVPKERFVEVFVDAPIDVCEARYAVGKDKKARAGKIRELAAISAKYQKPRSPDLVIPTTEVTEKEAVTLLLRLLREKRIV